MMPGLLIITGDQFDGSYYGRFEQPKCTNCGCSLLIWNERQPTGKLNKHDFASTYDLAKIVSDKAREFLIENSTSNLKFYSFCRNGWRLECQDIIFIDPTTAFAQTEKFCIKCGRYRSQVNFVNARVIDDSVRTPMGIYFSDQLYGSKFKTPLLIAEEELIDKMKRAGLDVNLFPFIQPFR